MKGITERVEFILSHHPDILYQFYLFYYDRPKYPPPKDLEEKQIYQEAVWNSRIGKEKTREEFKEYLKKDLRLIMARTQKAGGPTKPR